MIEDASRSTSEALQARVAELEAALAAERATAAAERARADEAIAERDRLREGYRHLQLEVELARRRLVIAKAERVDTHQLELEFAAKLRELDVLAGRLPGATESESDDDAAPRGKGKARPKGRRRLAELDLPEERVELTDLALEGSAARIGTEDSYKLMWRRAGYVRLVIARVKYKVGDGDAATITTAELPRELITRSLAAPSLLAHIASDKFCDGLPLHRQEDRFARLGARIDRGTMCRWLEDLGMTVGATVVAAMRDDALSHAFCIATDATGVLVQPIPGGDKQPRACARGHYFVQIADADHVFFEYTAKETSAAVAALFRGFSGYVQADAKSVHDVLFRPPGQRPPPDDDADADLAERHEVGCWAHARRKFWEAAITKEPIAREGSRASRGSSRSIARGATSRPPRSGRCASCTCAPTPTRSSRGSTSSTSGSARSAASCAPPSATLTASAVRSPASTTTADSVSTTTPPSGRCAGSPSAAKRGSSSAPTTTPRPPAT